ncbi:tape measure protein [Enterococcus faecalis]|nr:tape measure protein [Enterococcus faecalis]
MADGSVVIDVDVNGKDVTGLNNQLDQLEGKSAKASRGIGDMVKAMGLVKLGSAAFDVLKGSIEGAVTRFDKLNQFPKVLTAMGASTDDATRATNKLKEGIDGLPTKLQDVSDTTQQMYSVFKDADLAADSTLALNNALLASGSSGEKAQRGTEQYMKILRTGKVDLDSYTTLQETMGFGLDKLAEKFGFTGKSAQQDLYKALQSGQVTVEQFNQGLIDIQDGLGGTKEVARKTTEGIATSFSNLKNSITNGMANVLTKFDEIVTKVSGKSIAANLNSLKGIVNNTFSAITKAMDGLIPVIDSIKKAFADNQSIIKIFSDTFDQAFKIIGFIVYDVINILQRFWGEISKSSESSSLIDILSSVFTTLKDVVLDVLENIQYFFDILGSVDVPEKLGAAFNNLKDILFDSVEAVANFFGSFNLGETSTSITETLIDTVILLVDTFLKVTEKAKDFIKWIDSGSTASDVFKGIIVALGVAISGVVLYYKAWQTYINLVVKAQKAWNLITKIGTGIQTAFNAVMSINPIFLIVGAIAALIAGLVYWITKTKSGQKAWKAFTDWLVKAWEGMVDFFKGVWEGITDIFDSAVKTVKELWKGTMDFFKKLGEDITSIFKSSIETAKDLWSGVTEFFQSLLDGIISAFNTSVEFLKGIWQSAVDVFNAIWETIGPTVMIIVDGIVELWNNFTETITGIWEGIKTTAEGVWELIKSVIMGPILLLIDLITGDWEQLKEDLSMIWESIKEAGSMIWDGIQQIIGSYVEGVVNFVKTVWETGKNFLSDIWEGISNIASTVWDAITSTISNLAKSALDGAKNAWSGAKQWASDTWESVKQTSAETWDGIKTTVSESAKNALEWAKSAWSGAKQWASDTWEGVKQATAEKWENTKSTVANLADATLKGMQSAWSTAKSIASDIWEGVKETVKAAMDFDLFAAGRAIMESFTDGLTHAWEATKEFVSGIGDWIREHKGPISYDRKLLIPAGKAIMGGLNESLQASFKSVQKTIKPMANQIADTLSFDNAFSNFNFTSPELALNTNMMGAANLGSQIVNNSNFAKTYNPTININIEHADLSNEKSIEETSQQLATLTERQTRGRL